MADETPIDLPLAQPPVAQVYGFVSAGMLFIVTLLLLDRSPDVWSTLPFFFGAAFLGLRWREGPAVVLIFVSLLLAAKATHFTGSPPGLFRMSLRLLGTSRDNDLTLFDFGLGGAFLAYAVAHYRYLGFVRHILPHDGGRRTPANAATLPRCRSAGSVTGREFLWLFITVVASIGLTAVVWSRSPPEQRPVKMEVVIEWGATLLWFIGLPLLLFHGVLAYLNRLRATPPENLMYLQEQLWRETRREQSRANRWLTWARLRGQRRKESR